MEELLKSLQELLAIESVARRDQEKPFGNGVAQALDYTLSLCQRMGFHTKNADGLYGYAEIGEGAEIIGCLGHLDVVPAGDGWHYPPYAGTIDGGRLYGRGTIDDKGPTLIALFAAHDVAQAYERAGKPMPRRIRFIFGQTEESGPWDDMAAYVAHEEPVRFGFTPDADFPAIYCEKGILRLHLTMPLTGSGILDAKGGTVVNMVPDACTVTTAAGTYQAAGKCAHGSTPWRGENAIDRAMEQLPAESGPFAVAYRALFGNDVYGKKLGIAMTSPDSGPLSMNVGLLRVRTASSGFLSISAIRKPLPPIILPKRCAARWSPTGSPLRPSTRKKAFIRTKTAPSCKAFWRPIGRRRETFPRRLPSAAEPMQRPWRTLSLSGLCFPARNPGSIRRTNISPWTT